MRKWNAIISMTVLTLFLVHAVVGGFQIIGVLPGGSASLYLVKQVRDEAHRFAITFHRELRGKGMTASVLDGVAGLGPIRKKALMKAFKSFKNLRAASLDDIKAVPSLPDEVAEEVFLVLQQYNERQKKR